MYIEDISPVIVSIGSLEVRWYGLLFAVSVLTGFYYLLKYAVKKGIKEDNIYSLTAVVVISSVIGARAVFVATNWSYFMENPELIFRIDLGGLAFHGGLLGGILSSWLFCQLKGLSWGTLADLAVPGVAVGKILVRIGNIFNQEILGREAEFFAFDRHPTQVYGSLIGLVLLLVHNYLARREEKEPGYLFWSFFLGYTLLRALIEETFRENPLPAWGYINETWGFGFFTAVHLVTPALLALALYMLWLINRRGNRFIRES